MRCAPESLSGGGAAPAAGVSVALPSRRPQPRGQSAPTWTGLLLALLVLLATTLSLTQAGDCPLPASSTTLLKWDLQVEGQQNIKIDVVPEALQALEAIDGGCRLSPFPGTFATIRNGHGGARGKPRLAGAPSGGRRRLWPALHLPCPLQPPL